MMVTYPSTATRTQKDQFTKFSLLIIAFLFLLTSCRKKEWDDYYGRPDSLEQPIYQQLEAKGNFNVLLACIDKAGYKDILSKAGYWTFFAPNDAAFNKYFQENNLSGLDAVSEATAQKIVRYSLVYNAFKTDRLADFQSNAGWMPNMAFKRRTTYYDLGDSVDIGGGLGKKLVVASNRNNNATGTYYAAGDNNNKYIPYFMDKYFTARGLTAADYDFFYPSNPYNGFNVSDAQVVTKDIIAENGVVHEINRVVLPLPSIDQHLTKSPDYSVFTDILNKYMVSYLVNADATARNQAITGSTADVYVKVFNARLAYSPNNENYMKVMDNDGQMEGYSLFAPTNAALSDYLSNVLLEHYPSLDALPQDIILDFLNAHMWNVTVWPGKFAVTPNSHGQGALFDAGNIVERKVLSNGIFYGTNKVQNANVFSSVFGKAYLDPAYSLMTRALTASLKLNLINTSLQYTLFLVSDAALTQAGFLYDIDGSTWRYTDPIGGPLLSGSAALDKLNRILNTHVVREDLGDLSGEGIVETYNGEYIRFNNNTLVSAGNEEAGVITNATDHKTTSNGSVYYVDQLLSEPALLVGKQLEKLAADPGSNYSNFFSYLNNSNIYTKATGAILGITAGSFYTIFVPDNAAIDAAIAEGWLPASNNPSAAADKEQVANFIRYHIVQKATVVPDGKKEGGFLTLLQKNNGDPTTLTVTSNTPGNMEIRDMLSGTAHVITANSNNLSNRTVIHQINTFLKFSTN